MGRYRPVRVADGPITARCRFIKNASWVYCSFTITGKQFTDIITNELQRQNTYLRICAPSKDSACALSDHNFHCGILDTKDAQFLHVDNEDPDSTVRMRRLI